MAFLFRHSKKGIRLERSGREILVFLFFLVISAGFWFFTALNQSYEKEVSVPVELTGVPDNVIVDGVPDTIRVVVRDKGFAFLDYNYGRKVRTMELKFKNFADGEGKGSVTTAEMQKLLTSEVLYGSSKVVSIKPERLDFVYDKGSYKMVPVRLAGDIKPADNYYVAHSQIVPEKVKIYALKSKLDDISYVTTEDITQEDFVDSVVVEAKIKKMQGVKIIPDKVRVTLYADVMTEQTFEVPISVVNVPDSLVLRTFPTKAEVKFNVGASQYRSVRPEQFGVVLDYTELKADSDKCAIHLRRMPSNVKNARLQSDAVDYIVEAR